MASKRRNPLEVSKASASSSDEEDSEQSDIEEKEVKQQNNVVEEEDEDEDDESGEDGEEAGSGSESESADESDADSAKTPPSPNVSDFTIKPVSSRPPMKDSDTPTKPESKPNKKKRVSETEPSNQDSSKSKKNKPSLNEDDDGVEESAKKGAGGIPRLWSSEDEIVILNGMVEYQSSKGTIMYSDMEAFHEFIKKSLHVEVSKNQLMDKIRRLKKKYLTLVEKGKDGEDPAFSKPHEGKIFELSKNVWSFPNDSKKKKVKNVVNGNVKIKSETDSVGNSVLALPIQEGAVKQEKVKQEKVGVSNWGVKRERKGEVGSFESDYPCLNAIVESGKLLGLTAPILGKFGMKEMLSSTESSKLKELEKKGKKLMMDEAELYLKRLDLIEEQTKLILAAMRASSSKSSKS